MSPSPVAPFAPRNSANLFARDGASPGRVLILLHETAASRGILRAFSERARELGWLLLHHRPSDNVDWLRRAWDPEAILIGPDIDERRLTEVDPARTVSLLVDRSASGIASVCLDDAAIGSLAAEHLLATGLKQLAVFRGSNQDFALARERAFCARVRRPGVSLAASPMSIEERGVTEVPAILRWLSGLPQPCGVFACTDVWAKEIASYARAIGRRIPEDLAIIGVDNDLLHCEMVVPPLSSVIVPWQAVGEAAAELVQALLSGDRIFAGSQVISPLAVNARRSTEVLAVEDELVARAVLWIRENAAGRLSLDVIARQVGAGRQSLERRFRRILDRTIQQEIRRTRVEAARRLLETTDAELNEIAHRSGFTTAALLNLAFHRELGLPPGAYRRHMRLQALEAS